MSKLFKLKEWLTVPDAARHLSVIYEEEVTEADVLQLALSGNLKLSINFVNKKFAKFGRIVNWEGTEWFSIRNFMSSKLESKEPWKTFYIDTIDFTYRKAPSKLQELIDRIKEGKGGLSKLESFLDASMKGQNDHMRLVIDMILEKNVNIEKLQPMCDLFREIYSPKLQIQLDGMTRGESSEWLFGLSSIKIGDDRFINFDDEIKAINGVWDLCMIGSEKLAIQQAYQDMTKGAIITGKSLVGCFIENPDGLICQLQEEDSYYPSEYRYNQPGSLANLANLQIKIEEKVLGKTEAKQLIDEYEKDSQEYLKKRVFSERKFDYYPAAKFPYDSILVVRTAALREFEQYVANVDDNNTERNKERIAKPESTRKTENLLRALTAIAIDDYGYDPESLKSNASQDIANAMSNQGVSFDAKTIRNWLKEGAALLPPKREED